MISHLYIKNFAIIDEIDIDFNTGLNIMTGETGSGKSIIIEAISLALGNRADTTYIRHGKDKAIVEVVVDDCPSYIAEVLKDREIEIENNQIIFRRELSSSGKNICRLNGLTVPLSFLNSVAKQLVDIHGQYDHQSLLNPDFHINFVDNYNKNLIFEHKQKVFNLFNNYKTVYEELKQLKKDESDTARNLDFMRFELDEIESAGLHLNEDTELSEKISLLQNSEKIFLSVNKTYDMLYNENQAIIPALKKIMNEFESISSYHKDLENFSSTFNEIYYNLEDISYELSSFKSTFEFSTDELDNALLRLDTIDKLKIKYGNTIEEILDYSENLKIKLNNLENNEERKLKLESELQECKDNLKIACENLSKIRIENAKNLEEAIQQELIELNFSSPSLKINISSGIEHLSESGFDKIEFLLTTNAGELHKPLYKIASGGEISRIMLAFKKVLGSFDSIPTMIFDEIDTGISGKTASIVGKKLQQIACNHQVFCITHLPQIAAFGTENFKILKFSDDYTTHTTLTKLTQNEKVQEIARMLGGEIITDNTLISAKELINASISS